MKSIKFSAAALLATLAMTVTGCGTGQASVAENPDDLGPAPLPVLITSVEKQSIFAAYDTTSTIASDAEALILARVAGQVVEILVEEGDTVEKGQLLARLDGDRLRLEMLQAKANLEKMSREYDRLTSLHERGLVSAATFEGLKYDREAIRAAYQLKRLNYSYTEIRATISGVISSRDINHGTNIKVGESAFTVSDTSSLVAYLSIPQTELSKFASGHETTVSVDSMPGTEFNATIARLSPTIDARNGTFRATVYISNDDGELAPGMFGRFTIAYEEHSDALVIPTAAVVEEDGESVVYVVTDGSAVRRLIQTGIRSGDTIEVLGGLNEHDEIVVTGLGGLRDGSRVLASTGTKASVSG